MLKSFNSLRTKVFMKKIKKVLSLLLLLSISVFYNFETVNANDCGSGIYVISAYYSPVPGQSRYATGAYESDIRLNGGGVTTASGVKVADAPGPFVAGPPCFPFGTVLEIEGLGRHLVLDRGGAIKGNRLDIWMGYGDVGLMNALTWGKRSVNVSVSNNPNLGTFNFDLGKSQLKSYQEVKTNDPFEFLRNLAFGDSGEDVARLQQILKDAGFYSNIVNGVYDASTKTAVESFNLAAGVVTNSDLDRAGRFGGDSIVKLKEFIAVGREKSVIAPSRILSRGSRGDDVIKLQEVLVSLGLLKRVTGIYDSDTVSAVIIFQLNEKVILSPLDSEAGMFGVSTQAAFDRVVNSLNHSDLSQSINDAELEVTLESSQLITDSLSLGSTGDQVIKLQVLLKDLNLFRLEPTGYFGPVTANAVYNFQLRVGLVSNRQDSSAGFVGPATRNALNNYLYKRAKFIASLRSSSNDTVQLSSNEKFEFTRELRLGDSDPEVRKLQEFLRSNGYFTGSIFTDFFGPVTQSALVRFKTDYNLLSDSIDSYFDRTTIEFVNSMI